MFHFLARSQEKDADLDAARIMGGDTCAKFLENMEKIYKSKERVIDYIVELGYNHPLIKHRVEYLKKFDDKSGNMETAYAKS